MTKKEFLKRCELIYDMNLHKSAAFLRNATDTYLRLRSVYARYPEYFDEIGKDHQGCISIENLNFFLDKNRILASDSEAYKANHLANILNHPCQKCAEDKNSWHTRYGFCAHKKHTLTF